MCNIRKEYTVTLSPIEKAYNSQLGLKNNKDYELWADKVAIALIERFQKQYKGVNIEFPKLREKSCKSIVGKLKNLQIERLSKLFTIGEIKEEDKTELYERIKERVQEKEIINETIILSEISNLIFENIEALDRNKFEEIIASDALSKSTKTALLRMYIGKIEKSNIDEKIKKETVDRIDSMYGEKATKIQNNPDANIIRFSSILELNENKIERLKDEKEFLRANDLRGMKIIPVQVDDKFETQNEKIIELLEKRRNEKDNSKYSNYTHQIIVEIGKEFYHNIDVDEEFLNSLNIAVIPGSNKHKKKENGYEAEHIKFISTENPNYTLEMQFKSEFVETICRGDGKASHENRPGKSRNLPEYDSDEELRQKLDYMIPKYTVFRKDDDGIHPIKFNTLQNIMGYFEGQINPLGEEFDKIVDLYKDEDNLINK